MKKTNKSSKRKKNKVTIKNITNYIQKNRKNIILIIALFLFIYITHAIFNDKITELDKLVHSHILNIRSESLTNILLTITNISSAYSLIVISIILIAIIKNKK